MMTVSTSEESERRLAEAMRAQAAGVGRPGFVGRHPGSWEARSGTPARPPDVQPAPVGRDRSEPAAAGEGRSALWAALVDTRFALLLALLGGVLLGVALGLLSLLVPGVLPTLG
jgi:ABC-type nitrate/sulfonate/bicarbonate transport system permease component